MQILNVSLSLLRNTYPVDLQLSLPAFLLASSINFQSSCLPPTFIASVPVGWPPASIASFAVGLQHPLPELRLAFCIHCHGDSCGPTAWPLPEWATITGSLSPLTRRCTKLNGVDHPHYTAKQQITLVCLIILLKVSPWKNSVKPQFLHFSECKTVEMLSSWRKCYYSLPCPALPCRWRVASWLVAKSRQQLSPPRDVTGSSAPCVVNANGSWMKDITGTCCSKCAVARDLCRTSLAPAGASVQ